MTTSHPLEDRQTTPLTVDDIPGPKGLPVVGNMFDVPADHQVVTLMGVVRELGPMVGCAPRPVIGTWPQGLR